MTQYSNADLEKLLGVKGHVIRYWEKSVPLIQPKRDSAGHFIYSDYDVQIFLRLKHLLYERKFTMEGAYEQLTREASGKHQAQHAMLQELRSELLELYKIGKDRDSTIA